MTRDEDVRIEPMRDAHLDEVLSIEENSFASPWRRAHFRHEMRDNRWAVNLVATRGGRVAGYACVYCIDGELQINNLCVHAASRGSGLGRWVLDKVLDEGRARGCEIATLEVRPSNGPARRLYAGAGFVETGRRRNYYRIEGEDAILLSRNL